MKYFKDKNNVVYAYESDGTQDNFIKPGLIKITAKEADALRAPPEPTLPEKFEMVRVAIQNEIDKKAREFLFSSGDSVIQYAGFPNKYQQFALVFADWEVSVWDKADEYRDLVILGQRPMLTPQEAIDMIPKFPNV